MKKALKRIDYAEMIQQRIPENHRIEDEIFLLDEYSVNPVMNYEFVSTENSFIEVLDGQGTLIVNGKEYRVDGHCLLVYLQGQTIIANITSQASIQRVAIFTNRFMELLYKDAEQFEEIRYSIIHNPVIPLTEQATKAIDLYVKILKDIASRPSNPRNVLSAKFATLTFFYGPLQDTFTNKISTEICRDTITSSNFFKLVEQHFREEHGLAFYTEKLKVNRLFLHKSVLAASGKAPGYWIDQYLIKEAKKLLLLPKVKISDIAGTLNFSESHHFSRFFKLHTGMTPREYIKASNRQEE